MRNREKAIQYFTVSETEFEQDLSYVHVCTVYCLDTAFYCHISIDRYDNTIILMYLY